VSVVYLDTHIAVRLFEGKTQKLTQEAKREIERRDLLLSPMAYVELDNLRRRGRVRYTAGQIYEGIKETFGVTLCDFPFPAIAMKAIECGWTSDPFDKIIVAHAWANGTSPLITADENIREHYRQAVW